MRNTNNTATQSNVLVNYLVTFIRNNERNALEADPVNEIKIDN
jgi:hypothetical protein